VRERDLHGMNHRASDDFAADYALLRAPYGCDLAELKRCYRLAVRALHPDRNPDLAADQAAQDALQELTSAYRRLTQHARDFGRLPAARRPAPQPRAHPASTPAAAPRKRSRSHVGWMVAAALVAIAVAAWPDPEALAPPELPAVSPVPVAIPGPTASLHPIDPAGSVRAPAPSAREAIRIGDSKRTVRALLGAPLMSSATLWEYGPSHVMFEDGRVTDWYNSPLQPIRVDEASRK
jgi:hypothetical protein